MLQLSDFNEKEGLLHVRREKGSISQDYQILPVELTALRAWLKIRGRDPGPLFPSRQKRAGGLGIHRNQLFPVVSGMHTVHLPVSVLKKDISTRFVTPAQPYSATGATPQR